MKNMRLFTKTFLYTLLLMCVIVCIAHGLLYVLLPSVYVNQKNSEVERVVHKIEEHMQHQSLEDILVLAKTYIEESGANMTIQAGTTTYAYSTYAMLSDDVVSFNRTSEMVTIQQAPSISGTVQDDETTQIFENIQPGMQIGSISSFANVTQADGTAIHREIPITLADGTTAQVLVTMNLQSVSEASAVMFRILPYTIGISILLSFAAAYLYARAITKPIHAICLSTKQMEALQGDVHCVVSSQDEIGELANNINHLYTSLQQTIRSLEEEIQHVEQAERMKVDFLRSASHELKTPLTSLSVILENMTLNVGKYKDHETYLKKCSSIVERLSFMIKDILDASSFESSQQANIKQVLMLDTWLQDVIEPYILIAKAKGIHVEIDIQEQFPVLQNPSLLQKVISNVMSNAIQYTEESHTIAIRLQQHTLSIENECAPISPDHLPHLQEAFYRPDFSRTKQTGGNGLGLYFVDQYLHSMQLPYEFLPYEKGMRFTISFPIKEKEE